MAIPHLAVMCLVGLVLGGCVTLAKTYPEKGYYALEAVREGEPLVTLPGTMLKVRKFRASPAFEGKQLVYRTSDASYEEDFYNEWFVPPNVMLTQQVMNWLATAGLFQYVMDSSGPLPASHILEGTLTALYGDYRATRIKAVLGLQFFLLHDEAGSTNIIWHKEYRKEVDVIAPTTEALVSGWNAALRHVLSVLDEDLNQTLLRMPPRR